MNIKLEDIGLTKDELRSLIVNKIVENLMEGEDGESAFARQIQESYTDQIKLRVQEIATQEVLPKVEDLLSKITFQETNRWGESEKPTLTFREYLVREAEKWISTDVNYKGESQAQNTYGWSKSNTRIGHMIHEHLHYHISAAVTAALKDLNSKIAVGLQKAVEIKLQEALNGLKITTDIKT